MENQKVTYLKQVYEPSAKIGEIVTKNTVGTLLQVCTNGSFIIKNDETNGIDTITKQMTMFIKFKKIKE